MDGVTSMSLVGSLMALTHSILINLFIKLKLNNFLLPPLLSIMFVQEYSVVLRRCLEEGFWRGETREAYIFARKMEILGKSYEVRHFGFICFCFVNMMFFDHRLLLTRRWKLVEVFMTVMMYRAQQHGRRGQNGIVTDRVNLSWGNSARSVFAFDDFHSLSLLVESKVSLSSC